MLNTLSNNLTLPTHIFVFIQFLVNPVAER